MIWSIRVARRADVGVMQAIELEAGQRFRTVGLDAIADAPADADEKLLAYVSAGSAFVAASSAGEVVGYVTASIVDGEGHVDQVSVLSAFAGRGIGRRLLEAVERWTGDHSGVEQDPPTVTLTTFRDVPWNGPYYARLGFVPLNDGELGPELAGVRQAERNAGIDLAPRIAMRKVLDRR